MDQQRDRQRALTILEWAAAIASKYTNKAVTATPDQGNSGVVTESIDKQEKHEQEE